MRQGMRRRAVAIVVALAGAAALAPAASAAITPSMSVTSATPAAAGATGDLGLDLKFAPTGTDSPDSVTLNLPPGVLANASIDNGQCLKTADITDATCQIGSGEVTALIQGLVPVTTAVDFYLVPPPAAGDLAGLAVADTTGNQIGTTNAIVIRPSGDPDGVGVTLDLTLPNTLGGVPISISEINSTFTGVRFPATCPTTPANVTMSANSYSVSTPQTASTPLPVSGCASLPYNPQYSLTAARDANDKQVKITTTVTQAATESPNSSVQLAFPLKSLSPSIFALHSLCSAGPASGKCSPVGSVTAASPDYPTPLTGQAYLTGSLSGLSLTLVFPAPFPLTLVGSVDLKTNVTTFTGLPDIPLTSLVVSLNSGPQGLFSTNCAVPTNTSTATLTDQNGDKTATPTAKFTITGCPASSSGGSGGGSGSHHHHGHAKPHVSARLAGLSKGHPSLRLTVHAAKRTRMRSFTVELPKGLAFRTHRVHKRLHMRGLKVTHANMRSNRPSAHRLTIVLKRPAKRATVSVTRAGLRESKALRSAVRRGKIKHLRLTVRVRTPKGRASTVHVKVSHLR